MNKLNIGSTGYPGTTESWKFLNTMIQELAKAVALQVTDDVVPIIIQGMGNAGGGNIADGWFVWLGELYRFEGGQPQDYVVIIEDVDNATYNTDMTNSGQLADLPTYYKRYARFGGANEGVDRFLFADMKRLVPQRSYIIKDEIRMYAGDINSIPNGWFLCDGQNGTVDLRGKFITALDVNNNDYNSIGAEGGNEELSLTADNLPAHTHTGNTDNAGTHSHHVAIPTIDSTDLGGTDGQVLSSSGTSGQPFTSDASGGHTHSLSIDPTGNNEPFDNRPQYYTLAFIQFKGL